MTLNFRLFTNIAIIKICSTLLVVTLCTYAQQAYTFGCIGFCTYVRIYIYIYIYIIYIRSPQLKNMSTKNRLFIALPLENLLLSVICCLLFKFKRLQCSLLHPASYIDRAIHTFPNKTWRPLALKYFLLNTPHPLG